MARKWIYPERKLEYDNDWGERKQCRSCPQREDCDIECPYWPYRYLETQELEYAKASSDLP